MFTDITWFSQVTV